MNTNKSSSIPLVELLMEVAAPVAGGITLAVLLRSYTTFPKWVCLLIALPVGTVLGWIAMIAILMLVTSFTAPTTSEPTEKIDSDEPRE